jgi:DNA-binding phage protein
MNRNKLLDTFPEFKELVHERIQREPEFAVDLFREAMQCYFDGDPEVGSGMLRDYIMGTMGWKELARMMNKHDKSLMRMLSDTGNPQADNFFEIIRQLQKHSGLKVEVRVS